MKSGLVRVVAAVLIASGIFSLTAGDQPFAFVDPLIGTEGTGSEYGGMMPCVGVPFGSFHLVPMTRVNAVGRTSYNALDTHLLGFILTRQPAIWMGDWGEVRILLKKPLKIDSVKVSPWQFTVTAEGRTFVGTAGSHVAEIAGDVDELVVEDGSNPNRMDANLGYPLPNFRGWWSVKRPDDRSLAVGVSLIGAQEARMAVTGESLRGESLASRSRSAWESVFSRVEITASDDVRKIFYTGLYHCLLYPRDITENGRYYSAFDDCVHTGTAYTCFSLWDTYRAEHPLLNLLVPERVPAMMTSLLQAYREGGWLPKWPNPGYTGIMTGAPAEIVLQEAMAKGFAFDYALAREAIRKNATVPQAGDAERRWGDREWNGRTPETRGGLTSYLRRGYVACDETAESVSRTLDFSFADRNRNYTNLWNAAARRFMPRKADGSWAKPGWNDYTECSPDTALWCVPHDVEGLVALLGGPEAFERELDRFFDELFFKPNGQGKSLHGNEPTHHVAYLYNRIGRYDKTCRRVREIQTRCYSADRRGFDGNEDCGAMSAWYVMSALGFYPLDPVSATYELGVPLVRRAVVRSAAFARPLVIDTRGFTVENARVVRVTLNGCVCADRRVSHAELTCGGVLLFEFAAP